MDDLFTRTSVYMEVKGLKVELLSALMSWQLESVNWTIDLC